MITIHVLDSISSSSHKNGIGKNVLISAKKLTSKLEQQRLKFSPLTAFFMYLLPSIIKEVNRLRPKNSPHPIWKTDTLLPRNVTAKNVLISAKKLTNKLEQQRLKVSPLTTFFMYLLPSIIKEMRPKNSPHPIWKTDTLLPSWNKLRP